jgi:hypothetical protein
MLVDPPAEFLVDSEGAAPVASADAFAEAMTTFRVPLDRVKSF